MKPINTPIFDFPTLLAKGCVYVDKTAQIYELVKPSADGRAAVGEKLPVYYVGVNYNPDSGVRTIDDVKCEES